MAACRWRPSPSATPAARCASRSSPRPGQPKQSVDGLFFLASVTKPIFATALMQLVEDGTLSLERPIADWLPEFTGGGKDDVTIAHLLTHTSGVVDISPDVLRRTRPSAARMTQLTIAAPLQFPPGTRWEYCSASFYLLAGDLPAA